MWNGLNDSLTPQAFRNYMFEDKVFLLDEITSTNCAYLIGDLTSYVLRESNKGGRLTFIINSPGGDVNVMMTIIGLINIAKLYDIHVFTFVLGCAASAASLIAVQGDDRLMSNISRHFVHFGRIFDITEKHSEIEKIYMQNKEYAENMINLYLSSCKGKLSREYLLKLQNDERGYLSAEECLKHGLCDEILEDELISKYSYEEERSEFEKTYPSFIKNRKNAKAKVSKTKKNK